MSTRLQSRRSNLSLAAVSRKAHAQSQNGTCLTIWCAVLDAQMD
jgi:hypothetical protein